MFTFLNTFSNCRLLIIFTATQFKQNWNSFIIVCTHGFTSIEKCWDFHYSNKCRDVMGLIFQLSLVNQVDVKSRRQIGANICNPVSYFRLHPPRTFIRPTFILHWICYELGKAKTNMQWVIELRPTSLSTSSPMMLPCHKLLRIQMAWKWFTNPSSCMLNMYYLFLKEWTRIDIRIWTRHTCPQSAILLEGVQFPVSKFQIWW